MYPLLNFDLPDICLIFMTERREPAKGGLSTLAKLLPFMAPYKRQFVAAGIALVIAAAATLAIPYAFRKLLDLGFGMGPALSPEQLDAYFLALFAVATILGLATAARFYMVSWLGERITTDLRGKVYTHVVTQSPQFFEITRTGEVLSRLTTDTTLIQTVVGTSISLALRNLFLFIGGMVMLFVTSVQLSSLILLTLLAVILPIVWFGRRVRKLSRASQDRIADTSALAGEILNAMPTVQSFAREDYEARRYSRAVESAFGTALKRIRARALLTLIAIVMVFGAVVFVLWLGTNAVLGDRMTVGELGQFILYAVIVAGAIGALSEVFGDAQRAAGAMERLLELLAEQSPVSSPTAPLKLPPTSGHGASLSLQDVTFHYPSRPQTNSLASLSLDVHSGETLAIVGPSGAGKTTLFQLLLRFYDPQQGCILLDGVDIRELALQDLRSRIGIVPQDTLIFSADAMDNIRYGRLDASDEEVIRAAKMAAAHEFLERLPQGYRTFLGERGVRLSGGQKQRIAIARALLKNPPLLLLDEATSALDAESERLVQQALEAAMVNRTTLVIAHRLATVQRADRIIVMEHGRIVEAGTHATLVAQGGLYASLAALQFSQHDGFSTMESPERLK
jgi:ATP-binding cassette subfamily B protein